MLQVDEPLFIRHLDAAPYLLVGGIVVHTSGWGTWADDLLCLGVENTRRGKNFNQNLENLRSVVVTLGNFDTVVKKEKNSTQHFTLPSARA